ncbi:MAG: hypothetical protein U9Q12_04550, partial [Patescibacteria group bacterium]|nr:hypothetical protein [Patescibacteria group bacterium]
VGKLMVFIKPVWWNGEDEIVEYEDMLAMQAEVNRMANIQVDTIDRLDVLEAGLDIVTQIDERILAIDPDELMFVSNDGILKQSTMTENGEIIEDITELTLEGIMTVTTLKAENVETNMLTINDISTTEDADGNVVNTSSIGTVKIPAEETEVIVETTAIDEGGRVFVTPVSEMGGNTFHVEKDFDNRQFTIIIDHSLDHVIEFDWFLIN